MSKCKNQGLEKVICVLCIGLFLGTTPLIAMGEPSDPNEIKTISKKKNPQVPPIHMPESSDDPKEPATPSFSGTFLSGFVDNRE